MMLTIGQELSRFLTREKLQNRPLKQRKHNFADRQTLSFDAKYWRNENDKRQAYKANKIFLRRSIESDEAGGW